MGEQGSQNIMFRLSVRFFWVQLFLICAVSSIAQNRPTTAPDSVKATDSSAVRDSVSAGLDSAAIRDFLYHQQILKKHPYFNYAEKATGKGYGQKKKEEGKELYFYLLTGILLVFALFRTAFEKYFNDLMTLFFKRSLKQRQLKQQVSQNSLPSLLFNILYILVAGFYIALLVKDFGSSAIPFWQLLIYCVGFVTAVYLLKFMGLKLAGWMFQMGSLTDAYIFIVFLVNKIIGIALLPVIVIAALSNIELKTVVFAISWLILGGLFIYRFVQAFSILRKEKRVSGFHFLLYLTAFEILPILVIYKAMTRFLNL